MSKDTEALPLHELAQHCVVGSGLLDYHSQEKGERGLARKENLEELVSACHQFDGELVFPLRTAITQVLDYSKSSWIRFHSIQENAKMLMDRVCR